MLSKNNGIIAAISLCLGIGLGYKLFANKKPVDPPAIAQTQTANCTIIKSTKKLLDGSVEETLGLSSSATQAQRLEPVAKPKELGFGAAVFLDKQAQISKQIGEGELLGIKYKVDAYIKIDKYDDLNSNKSAGLGVRF